jgi:hypothetical protein
MSGWELGRRLRAHGVTFEYQPQRAHSQNHGQLRDTFLVDGDFSTMLNARYEHRLYIEVGIDSEDSCKKLARQRVYVCEDDFFTSYRMGLWLTSRKPEEFPTRPVLFIMEPPSSTPRKP